MQLQRARINKSDHVVLRKSIYAGETVLVPGKQVLTPMVSQSEPITLNLFLH